MFLVDSVRTEPDVHAVAGSVVPGAGTWQVGQCLVWSGTGMMSATDFVSGWVMVHD